MLGYIEEGEPVNLPLPNRRASQFVQSHFYLDDLPQSTEPLDENPRPHSELGARIEDDFVSADEGYQGRPFPQMRRPSFLGPGPETDSESGPRSCQSSRARTWAWAPSCTRRRRWWAPPRDQDPALLPPSPAPRRPGPPTQSPRTVPAIVASSFSKSGWKASQITAANKAQQQASSRLHRARSQSRKRSWSSSSKNRAQLRLRAVRLPHILVGRVFFGRHQEKRGSDRAMELILGEVQTNYRGGKFLPLKGNPMRRSTEPAAVMWEPSA